MNNKAIDQLARTLSSFEDSANWNEIRNDASNGFPEAREARDHYTKMAQAVVATIHDELMAVDFDHVSGYFFWIEPEGWHHGDLVMTPEDFPDALEAVIDAAFGTCYSLDGNDASQ